MRAVRGCRPASAFGLLTDTIFAEPTPPGLIQDTIFAEPAPAGLPQDINFTEPTPHGTFLDTMFAEPAPPGGFQDTISAMAVCSVAYLLSFVPSGASYADGVNPLATSGVDPTSVQV